jgi:dolichol kinase
MIKNDNDAINYKYEVIRKFIHLCSLSIPVVYYFITTELALIILIPLLIISLLIDLGRYHFTGMGKIFYKFFGFLLRKHEMDSRKKNLNGATYVFISAVIAIIILPKNFFILSFAVLILSDSAAALIGRRFGKHKFISKSLEGTIAFFIVGCLIVFFTPKLGYLPLEYLIAFLAVGVGAIMENVSYGWADDNLVIPLSIGLSMWILYYIFLPEFNTQLYSIAGNLFV